MNYSIMLFKNESVVCHSGRFMLNSLYRMSTHLICHLLHITMFAVPVVKPKIVLFFERLLIIPVFVCVIIRLLLVKKLCTLAHIRVLTIFRYSVKMMYTREYKWIEVMFKFLQIMEAVSTETIDYKFGTTWISISPVIYDWTWIVTVRESTVPRFEWIHELSQSRFFEL